MIFDVSTDRGIRSGNQTLTEIMYRLFLRASVTPRTSIWLSSRSRSRKRGGLEEFEAKYSEMFDKEWDDGKELIAFSLGEASRSMHELTPKRIPTPTPGEQRHERADITPGKLAERCKELMGRRHPGQTWCLSSTRSASSSRETSRRCSTSRRSCRASASSRPRQDWIIVTSQEKLTELVGGLDDKRVELARLMDRFPLQVHLEPSDISEVTSKRVLSKNAAARAAASASCTASTAAGSTANTR